MPIVLVTDGEQRAALAVVRALGKRGHRVYVCSNRRSCLAGASRYAAGHEAVPNPLEQPEPYAAAVADLAERWRADLVIPNTEASLLALLPARDRIRARIPWPSHHVFQSICDKARVTQTAAALGIAVPAQVTIDSREAASTLNVQQTKFPLVLKPARSVIGHNGRRLKLGVRHIPDGQALATEIGALPKEAFPVLLQERLEGSGVGIFVLLHDGELLAAFAHRRIREKPPSGGVSVYRESIPLDQDLLTLSLDLLRGFEWQGPAMVEYKLGNAAIPHIMEINGRFWGSLQLAIDAGVDFPSLLVAAAVGERPRPVTSYRTGVRSRWLLGDVDHLLLRLRRSGSELGLEPGASGRAGAIGNFLAAFGPASRSEVFRLQDPAPGIREFVDWLSFRE